MSVRQPAFQFYTGDWLKDPHLGMCSEATRGIWIDAIAAMHENSRSGVLAGTYTQLARICRTSPAKMQRAVEELKETETATVTVRNGRVTLKNRRMCREAKSRRDNALRQKRHRKSRQGNKKVTSPPSSSCSTSVTVPTEPADKPPNRQRERVQRVLDVLPEIPPAWAGRLLKKWDQYGDDALIAALVLLVERYPQEGYKYIVQVLGTAHRNGGRVKEYGRDASTKIDHASGKYGDDRVKPAPPTALEKARTLAAFAVGESDLAGEAANEVYARVDAATTVEELDEIREGLT